MSEGLPLPSLDALSAKYEDMTCHQPSWSDVVSSSLSDLQESPDVGEPLFPTDAELHFAKNPPRTPDRVVAASLVHPPRGVKRPRKQYFAPDLELYFDQLGSSDNDRIRVCRAYASYLASKAPPKRRKNE